MKFYRVHYKVDGESIGFDWVASEKDAAQRIEQFCRNAIPEKKTAYCDVHEIKRPTRGEILDLLCRVADHPDNG